MSVPFPTVINATRINALGLFTGQNNGALAPAGIVRAYDRIYQDADLFTVRINYRWGGAVVAGY